MPEPLIGSDVNLHVCIINLCVDIDKDIDMYYKSMYLYLYLYLYIDL